MQRWEARILSHQKLGFRVVRSEFQMDGTLRLTDRLMLVPHMLRIEAREFRCKHSRFSQGQVWGDVNDKALQKTLRDQMFQKLVGLNHTHLPEMRQPLSLARFGKY